MTQNVITRFVWNTVKLNHVALTIPIVVGDCVVISVVTPGDVVCTVVGSGVNEIAVVTSVDNIVLIAALASVVDYSVHQQAIRCIIFVRPRNTWRRVLEA